MAKRWVKPPQLTYAQQIGKLRKAYPGFRLRWKKGDPLWEGSFQPRISSPSYRLQICYSSGSIPKVWVLSPALADNPPHVYGDGSLCLYWPKEWRWRDQEYIADTILPWAALWLYYYELWLDTGQWLGPSSHEPIA